MERIGKLNDEGGNEHRSGEQGGVDARQQARDQKDPAKELTVRGDVAEEDGDAVGGEALGEGRDTARAEHLAHAVRNENQAASHAQDQRRTIQPPTVHLVELFGPITLFVSIYLATFLAIGYASMALRAGYHQWAALAGVVVATALTIRMIERGRWRLGVFVPPSIGTADFLRGGLFAVVLILVVDGAAQATTHLHHVRGSGFPWLELITVFAPAAVHEELLFRGYIFQKMRTWSRMGAIGTTSIVFAALHATNRGISTIAIINLIIAGVLLALAYERYQRLWFPIGIHFVWNILSGPILGYGVSGYAADTTVFRTIGSGPLLVTGGAFGIEGSVWMAAAELGCIFWLARGFKRIA
jgi:membrane protease YdiL (CAAX protease family)